MNFGSRGTNVKDSEGALEMIDRNSYCEQAYVVNWKYICTNDNIQSTNERKQSMGYIRLISIRPNTKHRHSRLPSST